MARIVEFYVEIGNGLAVLHAYPEMPIDVVPTSTYYVIGADYTPAVGISRPFQSEQEAQDDAMEKVKEFTEINHVIADVQFFRLDGTRLN